ncbi:hypothetical protein FO519_000026 [Halicephalobus sp. NKZ332]|nr:hypothetical protein FO519_000026 [Halicephalobus sp. NKZ332]
MSGHRARSASHAGTWYSDNPKELDKQLGDWLGKAGEPQGVARAIISPHAGYSYCGDTASFAYKQIVPEKIRRVFVLGPSHVVYLNGCALTTCNKYRTPLGDLIVDQEVNEELMETGSFESMDFRNEEAEHSIEMQLPFIAKVFENKPPKSFTIVPVLVGSLSNSRQVTYGKIFAKYIADPHNLFVISSDFCHWGSRFRFTPHDQCSEKPIHEQIAQLDRQGMDAIATLDPQVFNDYLKKTQNTICGRNPICVMLQAAEHFRQMNNHTAEVQFLKYSQSNKNMLKMVVDTVQEIECFYHHDWMDAFFEDLIASNRRYIKIMVTNALFNGVLEKVIRQLDKRNVTIDLHTVDSLLVLLEGCNLNYCRLTRPLVPELKLPTIKCKVKSLDLSDYYGYLTPFEEVETMESLYSESVKELKLWSMCSLPYAVKNGFPNLEKLKFTLYDEAEDNYVNYILGVIKWVETTDISEITICSINAHVVQVERFEELHKHGFVKIREHMNLVKLNADLFCDLFSEIQTFPWNPGDEFLDLEDIKKFMLIGKEATNGVSRFFSNVTSLFLQQNHVDVTIQLCSQMFKCRLIPDIHLLFIQKILVISAFYTKEVTLGTFESWMTSFFYSLSNNERSKPIRIIINNGFSFDLCIVEAIKRMNERNVKINMVIRIPGILENLNNCKLDYLKLEMLFLPMVETLMNCICHIKKLDLGHYNIEAGSGPSITIQNDLLKSVEELILPDVQPFFPLDSFTSVRSTFPNAEKISIEVFVGWILDPHIIINHLLDIYNAIHEAPQREIFVSVKYLNSQHYMYRRIIEVLEVKEEFKKIEEDKFLWIDPGNPLKKLRFGFDTVDFSERV